MQRLSSQLHTHEQARAYIMDQLLVVMLGWVMRRRRSSGGLSPMNLNTLQKSQKNTLESTDQCSSADAAPNALAKQESSWRVPPLRRL